MPRRKKQEQPNLKDQLMESVKRWHTLKEVGGSDPFWEDGVNMNLVRNHIIYYINECEKAGIKVDVKVPDEVDPKYMANADGIRNAAPVVLEAYKADENYQWLVSVRNGLDAKVAKDSSIDNVIGYVAGLEVAIKADDLVGMRRHTNGFYDNKTNHYFDSFKDCRKRIETMIGKSEEEEEDMSKIKELEETIVKLQEQIDALKRENEMLMGTKEIVQHDDDVLTKEQEKMFEVPLKEIKKMSGVTIKANRTWLWVGGETKGYKDTLKGLGFRWSGKRNAWYMIGA